MPKVIISSYSNGVKTVTAEEEISKDKAAKIREMFVRHRAEVKDRMRKRYEEIPPINWEILRYGNNHTKEEVISKYPDHIDFIESIRFPNI